ncbi:Secreted protein OS=Streptomyces fumanus OX=67302 GN=GCM10018772_06260 PE=4 SV=1 [Streptomyces fumanus]
MRTLPFATGSVVVHKRGGYLCAVTVPEKPGTKRTMSVSVRARGGRAVVDEGRYAYRAGPVTVQPGGAASGSRAGVGRGSVSSGWILC